MSSNNIIYLEDLVVNIFKRVLTIDNCNIIALLICILLKNRVNCIAIIEQTITISAYFVAEVSIKIKNSYLSNNRDFFF